MALAPIASMLAPEAITLAESLGGSLLGKEGFDLAKKGGTFLLHQMDKELSPSKLLSKLGAKAKQLAGNPQEVKHVLDEVAKTGKIAVGSGKHLAHTLNAVGVLPTHTLNKFDKGATKVLHRFHHTLGKLSKVHQRLVPWVR